MNNGDPGQILFREGKRIFRVVVVRPSKPKPFSPEIICDWYKMHNNWFTNWDEIKAVSGKNSYSTVGAILLQTSAPLNS